MLNYSEQFTTPILVVIFNRPDKTKKMLEILRTIKPTKLYVAADGPRTNRPGEKELCDQTKNVFKDVDWPCEVHTDFLEENIGPCKRVPLAIDRFFAEVEEGIILEDDCLPDLSFFPYCQELLAKYRDNPKIMVISGNNMQDGTKRGKASYYFSIYPTTWGWATWKRAWDLYDQNMERYPAFVKQEKIDRIIPNEAKNERHYWLDFFKKEYNGKYIFWDVKWLFTMWSYDALGVIPNSNLVTNIGFGKDATHTKGDLGLSIPTISITGITHPVEISANQEADRYLYNKVYRITFLEKVKYKLRQLFW